ncbi:MAG TPA: helix-turn-helix transcriptional regulator [Steroidobacteraceae bacterium]|nr:helix-turn-helix transcriptional regulator [Steroidobacteraceae bacterium]
MKLQDRVALRIRTIRKRRGLTQDELAEKIDRTGDAVSQLERGKSLPSFETLERLAVALDVPIRDFFDVSRSVESSQRTKLNTALLDIAGRLSEKDLQMAVNLLTVIVESRRHPK